MYNNNVNWKHIGVTGYAHGGKTFLTSVLEDHIHKEWTNSGSPGIRPDIIDLSDHEEIHKLREKHEDNIVVVALLPKISKRMQWMLENKAMGDQKMSEQLALAEGTQLGFFRNNEHLIDVLVKEYGGLEHTPSLLTEIMNKVRGDVSRKVS